MALSALKTKQVEEISRARAMLVQKREAGAAGNGAGNKSKFALDDEDDEDDEDDNDDEELDWRRKGT